MHSNLRTRVLTALVLAVIVLGTLSTGSTVLWALLVTVFCGAAAWEFRRLSQSSTPARKALSLALLAAWVAASAGVVFWPDLFRGASKPMAVALLLIAGLFWLLIAPRQLARRLIALDTWPAALIMPILIGAAWFSAVLLQRAGARFLVAVVVVTVVADVAGYFVGRAFGRVKLAPSISPGKTREGAAGGVVAAALWTSGVACHLQLVSGFTQILVAAAAGAFLGGCAVMGDLWESQLKRQAGAKDSSQLLPGHGGVLDRIDAQLAVLPLATLLLSLVHPVW